jgi:hypothetical protein
MITRKSPRSLAALLPVIALGLAAVTFVTTGCAPVLFRLDETRTQAACPWTGADSEIACASFRINREPLPFGFRDGRSQNSDQTRRSADLRSI